MNHGEHQKVAWTVIVGLFIQQDMPPTKNMFYMNLGSIIQEVTDIAQGTISQDTAVHAIPITILPTAMTSRSISLQDNQSQASLRSEEFQVHLDIS